MIMTRKQEPVPATTERRLERIFHTVDTFKTDLTRCGMRLQEAGCSFHLPLFVTYRTGVRIMVGTGSGRLSRPAFKGEREIHMSEEAELQPGRRLLIYNVEHEIWQSNHICASEPGGVFLKERLKEDFFPGSMMVEVQEIEYRHFAERQALMRRLNGGPFRLLLPGVKGFAVEYFTDSRSVLYRLEIGEQERIRGYIYLVNMMNGSGRSPEAAGEEWDAG